MFFGIVLLILAVTESYAQPLRYAPHQNIRVQRQVIAGAPPGREPSKPSVNASDLPDYSTLLPGVGFPPGITDYSDDGTNATLASLLGGVADWITGSNTTDTPANLTGPTFEPLDDAILAQIASGVQQTGNASGAATLRLPPTVLWDAQDLVKNRKKYAEKQDQHLVDAVDGVILRATKRLSDGRTYSVTYQSLTPPSLDKHDYMSIGPYMWPCNNNPCDSRGNSCDMLTGLPWVSCDGRKNPSLIQAGLSDTQFANLHLAATDLALSYWYTGDIRFATHGAYLVRIFFLAPTTRMNPHLKYAQLFPGVRDGSASGVIDFMKIVEILDAIEIIRTEPRAWTASRDHVQFTAWQRNMLKWLLESDLGLRARTAENNIAWWYHQTALSLALHVADTKATQLLAYSLPDLANAQISINGTLFREVTRPTSRDYVSYTLCAISRSARIARWALLDLWTLRRIENAVKWPMGFMNSSEIWPYPDSNPDFDWKFLGETWRVAATAYDDELFAQSFYGSGGAGNVYGYGVPPSLVYAPLLFSK